MSGNKRSSSRVSKPLDKESPEASSKTASGQGEEKQVDKSSQASASSLAKTKSDDQAGEDFAPSSSFEHKCVRCEAPYSTPELKRSSNLCPSCRVLLSSPVIPPRRPLSPEVIIDNLSRLQIFEPSTDTSSDEKRKREREEKERLEKERLEREEKERLEREEKERLEREEKERLKREEKERLEREEKERLERERLERERLEIERLEREERERREQEGENRGAEGERILARENRNTFGLLATQVLFLIISTTILMAWALNKLIEGKNGSPGPKSTPPTYEEYDSGRL